MKFTSHPTRILFLSLLSLTLPSTLLHSSVSLPQSQEAMRPDLAPTSFTFAPVVEKVINSIVNISATLRHTKAQPNIFSDLQFSGPLGDMFRELLPFKENERFHKTTSLGSGFIVASSGLIVTNYHVIEHVIEEKGEIKVTLNSGEELMAKIIGTDPRSDLALLKVEPDPRKPLVALEWGDSQKARVGDPVLAIGNPFGMGGTVTSGIISHTKRDLSGKMGGETTHVDQWIQTDASINQGSSGGPLLDAQGRIIGVNTAIFTPTGGNIGIALAIPSAVARPVIQALKDQGCIRRGWIGVVSGSAITDEIAASLKLEGNSGVIIDDVVPGTPAEQAGIQPGDIILKVDGTTITSGPQLRALISATKPGQTITVTLWKRKPEQGSHKVDLKLTVKELENQFCRIPAQSKTKNVGLTVLGMTLKSLKDLPSHVRKELDSSAGVIVQSVQPTSPAIDKIKAGDVILGIWPETVQTPEDCRRLVEEALKSDQQTSLLFQIQRPHLGKTNILIKIKEKTPAS